MIRLVLVLVLVLGRSSLHAEPVEVVASLTLDQLVAAALQENPQLRAMRAQWEAMAERPVQERTLPNPMVAYMGMDEKDSYDLPNTNEKRLEVQQPFPWFGKLGLKGKIADKQAETMGREYEAMQREVIMMVKDNYYELYAVQRARAITRDEEDVLNRMQKIAETKYGVGEVNQQDVLKAQAELSMLKARLLELEQQETVILAMLNQLLNRRADASLGLAVTAPTLAAAPELERLFAIAAASRPEIKGAQAQIERGRHERALMRKEFFPDYRLGLEYRTFRTAEDMVMFTVGIELPIWLPKYRAGVREADKMIESREAAKEAAERQVSLDVRDAQFKWVTARRTLELYQSALIPQAQARFRASEAGYRTGKVDFLDLLESQRFLLNARVMAVMAEGNVGRQAARLERAIGTELKEIK